MVKKATDKALNVDNILFNCRDILRAARNSGSFFEKRDMMLTLVFLRFIGEKYEDGIAKLRETLVSQGLDPDDENIRAAFFDDATFADGTYNLPPEARWSTIINTPAPSLNVALDTALQRLEEEDPQLKGCFIKGTFTSRKASSIASMLTPDQLDLLSLMFTCTEVKYGDIKDIESLERKLVYLSSVFSKANRKDIPYLKMMECLDLKLPNVIKIQSEAYGFNENDVEKICPELVKSLRNDYGVSYVGIILGIVNAHNKTNMRFDPRIWIK